MAWVERRVTRTTQPQDAVGIDWSNVFGRDLLFAETPSNRRGGEKTQPVRGGMAYVSDGTSASNFSFPIPQTTLGDFTMFFVGKGLTSNVSGCGFSLSGPSSLSYNDPASLMIEVYDNTNKWGFDGVTIGTDRAIFDNDQQEHVVMLVRSNTDMLLYLDGKYVGVAGLASGGSITVDRVKLFHKALLNIDTPPAGSYAKTYGVIPRFVSAMEAKAFSDNPWQIFEPEVERIWISDYIATGGLTQVQSDASLNYVLQAITFNSQGGMYSILGLVNSDINSSYNVTEARVNSSSLSYVINAAVTQDQPESYTVRAGVDSTQNETYNILGAVQQSQNEEYNVLASLSSTQGSTYNVRSALSKDQGSTYFISESTYREQLVDYVIRSQQHNDQSATYSILSANSVGNNADLNYVISALIQQDQQENYLVRSSAHQETNGVYTVRSSAESTTEGSYAVRASLTGDATLDYSIRAEVNSSGSMSYTVRASLSKDQGLLYDILAASNVQASSSASYVIQATTANNTTCSYQIQGEVIDLPLTNAEMQQLYAWVGELVTKSATKEEIATAVWSKPQSELTVENSIGKWLMQKVLTVSKFLALK